MTNPISAIGGGLNLTIKIFEITYALKAVEQQTSDLLSTTRHVDHNVKEARRLRRLKVGLLSVSERAWMDGVIDHTEDALRAVAQLIEPARINKTTKNGINLVNRVMWVFRDNPQVRDRHQRLEVCHQSLTTVISCLYSKDLVVIAPVAEQKAEERPPPYDPQMQEFFDWRNRRKSRTNLREKEIKTIGSPSSMSSTGTTELGPKSPQYLSPQSSPNEERSATPATASELEPLSPTSSSFQSEREYGNNGPLFDLPARSEGFNGQPYYNKTKNDYSQAKFPNTGPTTHTYLQDKDPLSKFALPEIDIRPFATMMTRQTLDDGAGGLQIHSSYPVHNDAMLWDPQIPQSTTPSTSIPSPAADTNATYSPCHLPSELSSTSIKYP